MGWGRLSFLCLALAVLLPAMTPLIIPSLMRFMSEPLDLEVGVAEDVDQASLVKRVEGKRALVIGGTRGIGFGIALALAKAGANVDIVGRSISEETLGAISSITPYPDNQTVIGHYADLMTVKGCLQFAKKLNKTTAKFDYLVMTVGVWPDRHSPNNTDGINKVIAVDVVARFAMIRKLHPLLNSGARVMSVLASTMWSPFPSSVQRIKDVLKGVKNPSLSEVLLISAASNDAMLQQAGQQFPGLHFIGTHPGIVVTELTAKSNTFPKWMERLKSAFMKVAATETVEESGRTHAVILSSPNVGRRGTTYFNFLREARRTTPNSYDDEFGKWLWSFLDAFVAKHSR